MPARVLALALILAGCGETAAATLADAGRAVEDAGSGDGQTTASGDGQTTASPDAATPDDAAMPDDAAAPDAVATPEDDAGAAPNDAGPSPTPLAVCAPSGAGALVAPAGCVTFTAVEAGASPTGDNATEANYALEPSGPPQGALVVYLNASLSNPARQIADPTANFYGASAGAGFHVLALAYRSSLVVGVTCGSDAACYAPTRESIILGVAAPGAPRAVADIQPDEGIVARLEAALRLLDARQPGAGWGQFLGTRGAATPRDRIAWDRIIAAGHSQGGGHAAYLGRLFPLRRVVQLASTCDAASGTPVPWTHADATWPTDPATRYVGFAAARDGICPDHVAVWQAMGLDPARQHDDAAVCNGSGAHGGPIACTDNLGRWPGLLTD